VTEHLVRHGEYLTWIIVIDDPVYLSEPFIRTTNFVWDPHQEIAPYPCQAVVESIARKARCRITLPGANTFLGEFPGEVRDSPRGRQGWSGNDVSRVHTEAENDALARDEPEMMTTQSTKSTKSTKRIMFRALRVLVCFVAWVDTDGFLLANESGRAGREVAVTLALTALLGARGLERAATRRRIARVRRAHS